MHSARAAAKTMEFQAKKKNFIYEEANLFIKMPIIVILLYAKSCIL